jgi:ABC-2 type transport system ATP-binding protein
MAVVEPETAPVSDKPETPTRHADTVAIHTRSLTKQYGDFTAVDSLDLTVNQGEVFGLLGPNGAGKTTTILMLLGLSEPSGGTARVLGMDPTRSPLEIKRRVGYLPDAVGFYGGMTGRENLRYTCRLNGVARDEIEDRIDNMLHRVGLADAGDQAVGEYSRGMKQRLGLADALVKEPLIVILDEPTTAIDPTGVVEILDLIREMADSGVAVLLSSHLLHQVQQICDRVGIFVRGKMVALGQPEELAHRMGSGPVEIEVIPGPPVKTARDIIAKVPGVRAVNPDHRDPTMLIVTTDRDVRAELSRALATAGQPAIHLRRRGDELDEVYRRYFEGASA